jgi:hypothetical protein
MACDIFFHGTDILSLLAFSTAQCVVPRGV